MVINFTFYVHFLKFWQLPNVFGFTFGVAQMGLYMMYRNHPKIEAEDIEKEAQGKMARDTRPTYKSEVHPVSSPVRTDEIATEVVVVTEYVEENTDGGVHDDSVPCVVGEIN